MPHSRKQEIVSRVINGERVILDRAAGYVHQLNATASRIWDACDGRRSAEEIARDLAASFAQVPEPGRLLQDVQATLADLERLGLLLDDAWVHGAQSGTLGEDEHGRQ